LSVDETRRDRRWWSPAPLTYVVAGLFVCCLVSGVIGLNSHETGSDAAGNGMATALLRVYAAAGLISGVAVSGLYLIWRWRPARYACVAVLTVLDFAMVLLVH
jgi:hypothetical protein